MREHYHWSFNDNPMLRDTIFPKGFSAPESTLPTEGFDASTNWENAYDLVYSGLQGFTKPRQYIYGSLRLGAQFSSDSVRLKVNSIRQTFESFQLERIFLTTELICNRDDLFSLKDPSDWTLKTETRNIQDPATAPYRHYKMKGALDKRRIFKKGMTGDAFVYRTAGNEPIVNNWSLLAAVQSLPRGRPFSFSYLEELERFLPGHSIKFFEKFEARFGGRTVMLHGYTHTGPGIIPSFYWVDDCGRLLIARFGLCMLLYNRNPMMEALPSKVWKGGAA